LHLTDGRHAVMVCTGCLCISVQEGKHIVGIRILSRMP